MHVRELVDLAAVVSCHATPLVEGPWQLSLAGVEQYWTASKCRFDRWARTLKDATRGERNRLSRGPVWRATVEELLGSEILTRVWTAVLVAHDRRRHLEDAAMLARSVYHSHVELRVRALRDLLDGDVLPPVYAGDLNRLRRQAERWTDMLLAELVAGGHEVDEFAHEPARTAELAGELRRHTARNRVTRGQVLMTAMRVAFQHAFISTAANADANARLAAGILACLEPHTFDANGLLPQLFPTRLLSTAFDAQGLIDDLFADESYAGIDFVRKRAK